MRFNVNILPVKKRRENTGGRGGRPGARWLPRRLAAAQQTATRFLAGTIIIVIIYALTRRQNAPGPDKGTISRGFLTRRTYTREFHNIIVSLQNLRKKKKINK